eukprot:2815499-Pyramimonas_sp.AAC.1
MVQRSLVKVRVETPGVLRTLLAAMEMDETFGGFTVMRAVPELGLFRGHRLIEADSIQDVHALGEVETPA